jgi:hypothetical protein
MLFALQEWENIVLKMEKSFLIFLLTLPYIFVLNEEHLSHEKWNKGKGHLWGIQAILRSRNDPPWGRWVVGNSKAWRSKLGCQAFVLVGC